MMLKKWPELKEHRDVLVLLSGGMDSMVLADFADECKRLGACLFVDYGQPCAGDEMRAAQYYAMKKRIDLRVCYVKGLYVEQMMCGVGELGPRVVPGRNLMLISLAANVATETDCSDIWIGCTADDRRAYPDCRHEWTQEVSHAVGRAYGFAVMAPFNAKTKAEIVEDGRKLGTPLIHSWSCYEPIAPGKPCGKCNACKERRESLSSESE